MLDHQETSIQDNDRLYKVRGNTKYLALKPYKARLYKYVMSKDEKRQLIRFRARQKAISIYEGLMRHHEGKRVFSTYNDAQNEVYKVFIRTGGEKKLTTYRCRVCGMFHNGRRQ